MTSLVAAVRDAVREHPDEVAIAAGGRETTYKEFWAMAGRFAGALRDRGVGPGDPVALYLPNLPQFPVAFHGVLRAGGVVVPVNPQYRAREIEHIFADSAAEAVVTTTDQVPEIESVHESTRLGFMVTVDGADQFSTGFAEFLDEAPPVDFWSFADREDGDVAAMPYTSGTTGDPKGVELTHGNLRSNTDAVADLAPGGVDADDVALGALPLFHIYGMTVVMNATLTRGGTFLPMAEWNAETALERVEEEDVTILQCVPAMYNDMLAADGEYDLSSVRLAGSGGSGLPEEVLRGFEDRYDVTIYEGYGLTETSPVTHFNDPEEGRRVGSIGTTVAGVDARVVDEEFEPVDPVAEGPLDEDDADLDDVTGEIVVAGPNVMAGYHGLPAANDEAFTEADGTRWFHTGDVGYRDEDGYFYVVDRMTDLVVSGGYNVYPREVEELLFEHDGVADCAVVGVPDERRGETVKAFVVTAPGADLTGEAVRQYCLENLAAYKHPRVVEFVDELPRTTTGKVQKYRLREESEPVDPDDVAEVAAADAAEEAAAAVAESGEPTAADAEGADAEDAEPSDDGRPLRDLDGISEHRAGVLREAGYDSVADLEAASREDIAQVEGFGDALAARIKEQLDG
jgi:long-chain acyl-CoA synthetase